MTTCKEVDPWYVPPRGEGGDGHTLPLRGRSGESVSGKDLRALKMCKEKP